MQREDASEAARSETCGGCKYFGSPDPAGNGDGICRRYPPATIGREPRYQLPAALVVTLSTSWPTVARDDSCGEYIDA